ncbi:hypothetical protein G7054_g2226 [Neopestalotiopsis clavispora]|nr:hypothetical protein G7054_g2226 [Neopestalotiopsis clavispora]
MAKIATDFNKIINAGRERKKNEALAAKIFGSKDNRRASALGNASNNSPGGGSLASRVGVKKAGARGGAAPKPVPAGDINGAWVHDLHGTRSTPNLRGRGQQQQQQPQQQKPAVGGALASRIHAPGTKPAAAAKGGAVPTGPRNANNRAARLANAVSRTPNAQMNIAQAPAPSRGLSIRGLAGPYAVMAQNFAPGTTAADIESAMTPVGGIVSSCKLIKVQPIVIAEVVFESKEGANRVIQTFNNQTADGRLLHVYPKPAGTPYNPPPAPRAQRSNESRTQNGVIVDGSNGFDDPMESSDYHNDSNLYSDQLVSRSDGNNNNRRGRGFQNRGGRGR